MVNPAASSARHATRMNAVLPESRSNSALRSRDVIADPAWRSVTAQ